MDRLARFAMAKVGLTDAIRQATSAPGQPAKPLHTPVTEAAELLLRSAEEAGVIRPGITADDLFLAIGGLWTMDPHTDWQPRATRLLDFVMDGLRVGAPGGDVRGPWGRAPGMTRGHFGPAGACGQASASDYETVARAGHALRPLEPIARGGSPTGRDIGQGGAPDRPKPSPSGRAAPWNHPGPSDESGPRAGRASGQGLALGPFRHLGRRQGLGSPALQATAVGARDRSSSSAAATAGRGWTPPRVQVRSLRWGLPVQRTRVIGRCGVRWARRGTRATPRRWATRWAQTFQSRA